jgi:C1A family cysteine protease
MINYTDKMVFGLVSACVASLAAFVSFSDAHRYASHPTFDAWAAQHGKHYAEGSERDYRHSVWADNVRRVAAHNKLGLGWTMAVNKFADLTAAEFGRLYISGGYVPGNRTLNLAPVMVGALPASVDWNAKGAVTPVKDQGQCGSCWAFSSTGAVEGAWFLKNGTLVSVSEQQLVDCSVSEGNQGCNGGLMDYAFQYVVKNKGLTLESAYPYTATGPNACKAAGKPVAATLSGFKDVPTNSEVALMTAIVQQPVSVAVEADQSAFQLYSGGVMTKACGTNLDHGVLAVGYGSLGGVDYYLVKNSWGADWGMKGYIMLARGTAYGNAGQCGIQMDPSYPVV